MTASVHAFPPRRMPATEAVPESGSIGSRRAPLVPDAVAMAVAAGLIRALFPSRSEAAMCAAAALVLGSSEQTIRRILRGETRSAPWPVVARCQVLAAARGMDPLAGLRPAAALQAAA